MSNFFYDLTKGLFGGLFSKQTERSFFSQRVQMLGTGGAVYLDTDTPYRLYNEIPELNQVINKKADMFSNGRFVLTRRVDGSVVEDNELMVLLSSPNLLQSQNKWLRNYSIQLDVYGNQYIYMNKPSKLSKYPSSLYNLSPLYLHPVLTGKVYDQTSLAAVIKEYQYRSALENKTFKTGEVLWTKHDDLDNPLVGNSMLKSLRFPLTNTKLAYDYLNIISGEKGAIGMLSTGSKDAIGAVPMHPSQRQALENQFTRDYGVGDDKKARIAIVDVAAQWSPMSYPTRDLLLLEQIDANKLTICDHFGLNINIFSSKNQTYENVRESLKQSYQDAVIPAAEAFSQSLQKALGVDESLKLSLDYSHLSILKEDSLAEAQTMQTQLDSVIEAVNAGLLTVQQAQTIYRNSFNIDC